MAIALNNFFKLSGKLDRPAYPRKHQLLSSPAQFSAISSCRLKKPILVRTSLNKIELFTFGCKILLWLNFASLATPRPITLATKDKQNVDQRGQ